jgi:hypothetical protein
MIAVLTVDVVEKENERGMLFRRRMREGFCYPMEMGRLTDTKNNR